VKFASEQPNMTVLAWDGAVVGTRVGSYAELHSETSDSEVWIQIKPISGAEDPDTSASVCCRLGDFHYFTLFLEQLYGGGGEVEHAEL